MHTNSKDEALSLPTEDSARVAIRTQQIIAYESSSADSVDPLAGSYFIEYLTDQIEEKAFKYIDIIDKMGGAVAAVKSKFFQNEIARSAYEFQQKAERDEEIIVGVNKFTLEKEVPQKLLKVDEAVVGKQIERLRSLRKKRDQQNVNKMLDLVEKAARSEENLMPPIIQCAEAYATVGEISNRLRKVFGEFRE